DHPYNAVPCGDCWEDRVDKLLIWEPPLPGSNSTTTASPGTGSSLPVTFVSKGESLNLLLHVDAAHAASSYFKHPTPLFEAKYEFVHGPLCGPPLIPQTAEGELHFPFYEALGFVEPPKSIRCIWELRVTRDLDLWLHIDKIKFASRSCEDGRLEFFLPSKPNEPFLSVCGENVSSLKQLPILSAAELSALPPQQGASATTLPPASTAEQPSVKIQFTGTVSPARAAFKIAWTEMYHLPRNADGTMMTSRLTEGGTSSGDGGTSGSSENVDGCEFICPGDSGLCIPARLVCNGVINCPNITLGNEDGTSGTNIGSDEAPELCERAETDAVNWLAIGLGAAGGAILAISCLVILCRACFCHKRASDDDDIDFHHPHLIAIMMIVCNETISVLDDRDGLASHHL
ncbi:hypothetical protein L9F63_017453, partial [Diploptera punctata]